MAKRKTTTDDVQDNGGSGNGGKPNANAKRTHHAAFAAKGNTLIDSHRPRNASHVMETWLTPQRKYRILQVSDGGPIVAYDEVASYADPSALDQ